MDRHAPFKDKKKTVKEPGKIPEESFLFSEFEESAAGSAAYKPPPLTYLDATTELSQVDFKELEDKKEELSQRLNEFRIRGEIVEYTPGPVITTYEFVPDTGVKVRPALFSPVPGTVEFERAVRSGMISNGDDPLLHNNTLRTIDFFGGDEGYNEFRRKVDMGNEVIGKGNKVDMEYLAL